MSRRDVFVIVLAAVLGAAASVAVGLPLLMLGAPSWLAIPLGWAMGYVAIDATLRGASR